MTPGASATYVAQPTLEDRLQSITDELSPVEGHLWLLAVLAAVLDVLLTHLGLHLGLTEGNPVVAAMVGGAGILALAAVKGVLLGVAWLAREYRPAWGPWLSLGLAIPWLIAAAINAAWLATV